MFDEKTRQSIKCYVYMLVNPINKKPFYIGMGTSNRLFDHINCSLAEPDITNDKYEMIREIQRAGQDVGHIIIRHGLTKDEALQIEASLIDAFEYSDLLLSNKIAGHNSVIQGLMTSDEIKRHYNAEPLNELPGDCILININKNYGKLKGENPIYEATKGVWAINKKKLLDRNGNIIRKYVLSEYRGWIVEVFKVDRWFVQDRGYTPKAKKHGETRPGIAFEGKVADDNIKSLFIHKSIAHHKKRGSATAHRLTL